MFLSRRHYSEYELKEKLLLKGAEVEHIDEALAALVAEGILDEEKMVESFIYQRKEISLKGPGYIYRELIQKGIDKEMIEEGLTLYYDNDEQIRILNILIEKEMRRFPESKEKQSVFIEKTNRLLKRRGFNLALSRPIIEAQKIIALDKSQD